MRVLHLVHAFQTGGAERVVLNLIEHGSREVENYVCSLTEPNDLATHLARRGVSFTCLNKKPGNDPGAATKLAQVIGENRIDLVHSQGWGTYLEGLIAAKVLAKWHPRFVFAFHGKSLAEAQSGMPLRRRLAQRAASWLTDAYVAPAADMAADYARSTGIRPYRVRVIHNGIDTASFRLARDPALRGELGIGQGDFVVGFVGRLDPVKDIAGLLRTFSVFALTDGVRADGVRLLIVGDGAEMLPARHLASELGISDRIVFAGLRQDVARCMAVMDAYLQPSFYEGHSLTLLEAMASGLPVVSTSVGGTPEIVEHGATGYLHAPGNYAAMASSLHELYRHPDLRRQIGESGRDKVAREYSVEIMVDRYERLYRELLGTRRRCAA